MAVYEQEFIKPRSYHVDGRSIPYTADDLRQYMDGTNKAIAAGVPIPLLRRHAALNAGDDIYEQFGDDGANADDCVGWLQAVKQLPDGSLVNVLDVTDPTTAEGIKNKSIRFTSPEFRESYTDGLGREFGRVMRHVAFTPTPRNPVQGSFAAIAMSEGRPVAVQFDCVADVTPTTKPKSKPSKSSTEGKSMSLKLKDGTYKFGSAKAKRKGTFSVKAGKVVRFMEGDVEAMDSEDAADSDDVESLESAEGGGVDEAALQNLAEQIASKYDIMLPDGIDLSSVEGMTVFLAALANKNDMGAEPVAEPEPMPEIGEMDEETITPPATFSEEQKAYFDRIAGRLKAIEADNQKLQRENQQFAERVSRQNAATKRTADELQLKRLGLPKAVLSKLLESNKAAQFSESGAAATFTPLQVGQLIRETFPQAILFTDDETTTVEHPDGEQFTEPLPANGRLTSKQADELFKQTHPARFNKLKALANS